MFEHFYATNTVWSEMGNYYSMVSFPSGKKILLLPEQLRNVKIFVSSTLWGRKKKRRVSKGGEGKTKLIMKPGEEGERKTCFRHIWTDKINTFPPPRSE